MTITPPAAVQPAARLEQTTRTNSGSAGWEMNEDIMKLKNYTDIPDETIRAIIRAVKPVDVSGFDISIKNCRNAFRGRSYSKGCAYHATAAPLVIVSIGTASHYPIHVPAHGAYLPMTFYTRIEALLTVIAHELRHQWQGNHPRGWRVWGARGQFSERDADAYALRMLRAYRRGEIVLS